MKEHYLQKAEENLPKLFEKAIRIEQKVDAFRQGDSVTLDLGNHYVGYFSFTMGYTEMYPDAPVRLYVKFCESKEELDVDFASYHGGLSPSWLQEETINIDAPGRFCLPRRYAARYIMIRTLYVPRTMTMTDFLFTAVTSADGSVLSSTTVSDPALAAIDSVATNTLKNCMQRVFEDGPKRDRRLWIGDLRLEALTNYVTFRNLPLVRRCLYLFAAADCDEKGFLPGYVYENPSFVSGYWFLRDYALLFAVTLCDYYLHTGDGETFFDIYPVAKRQLDAMHAERDENGIVCVGNAAFIDWCPMLRKTTALEGVYLYALKAMEKTLTCLGHADASVYSERYADALRASLLHLYNREEKSFANVYDEYQSSVHAVVWMILGGAIKGDAAKLLLFETLRSETSIKPVTPYMNHYLVEAMMMLGEQDEALRHIREFWGAMVDMGADTFYEVFVPGRPNESPYGDKLINSMCHAWSCTPSYFIRACSAS